MAVIGDLTGRRFGSWVVTARVEDTRTRASQWAVLCDCGATSTIKADDLRLIRSNQCGRCKTVTGERGALDKQPASAPVDAVAAVNPARPVAIRPPKSCQWPVGRRGRAMVVCGAEAVSGRPYCLAHCGVSYVAVPSRQREDARIARQVRAFMEPVAPCPDDRP